MEQSQLILKRKRNAEAEREFTPIELAFIAKALILRECTADEIFGSELWDCLAELAFIAQALMA